LNAQTLAITPDGRFLYAANGAEVSRFSIGTGGKLTAMTCSGPFCSSLGVGAGPLAVSPSGRFLYVMTQASGAIVPLAIAADGSLSAVTCSTGCAGDNSGGYALAIAPDGKHLYATDGKPQTLLPYAINADGSLSHLSCPMTVCDTGAGTEPIGLTLDPAGNALYAVDATNNKLLPFSLDTSGLPSPLACSPASNCAAPGQVAYLQTIAALPDQAPTAALTATPAAATSPTSFDANASTAANGGHVASWSWSFGDGTTLTSSVPAVQHTYAAPGTYTATVTVADQDGCSSALIFTGQTAYCNGGPSATTAVTFTVIAKRTPPSPRLTAVSQTNSVWREGSHIATIARHHHPVGTKFRFTLNEPARITLTFTRARPGRRVRKRCVAQSSHNRHQHRCTRTMTVGSLTFSAQAGARTVSFQGRVSRSRRLTLGRYSVTISATDAAGHRTSAAPLKFRIVAS
jgi:DNA-binding beta-propeller fold protein YncE